MELLFDFFPLLLFFAAFKLYNIYVATAVIIVATCAQVGWAWYKHRKVKPMLLVTFGMVLIFGGATILLHDVTFLKWKPTILDWIFAVALIISQFVGEKPIVKRLMSNNIALPDRIWYQVNMGWGLFFLFEGVANLYVAYHYSLQTWVNFKVFGTLGLTLLFIIAQGFYISRYFHPEPGTETGPEKDS